MTFSRVRLSALSCVVFDGDIVVHRARAHDLYDPAFGVISVPSHGKIRGGTGLFQAVPTTLLRIGRRIPMISDIATLLLSDMRRDDIGGQRDERFLIFHHNLRIRIDSILSIRATLTDVATASSDIARQPCGTAARRGRYPHLKVSPAGRIINAGSARRPPRYGGLRTLWHGPRRLSRALTTGGRPRMRRRRNHREQCHARSPDTFGSNRPPLPNVFDRNGSPEQDIAPVILFLATKDAQFITGYSLTPGSGRSSTVHAEPTDRRAGRISKEGFADPAKHRCSPFPE